MAYKKLVVENNFTDRKKFVYTGEKVIFCEKDDYNFEMDYCEGLLRMGEVKISKDNIIVNSYDRFTDEDRTYKRDEIVILKIEENPQLRKYYDEFGKGGNKDEQEVDEDKEGIGDNR